MDVVTTTHIDRASEGRSMMLGEMESLEGQTLLSGETCAGDLMASSVRAFFEAHPRRFINMVLSMKHDDPEGTDILLATFCLHASQARLARIFGRSQTGISYAIRAALRRMLAASEYGRPTLRRLREALAANGLEGSVRQGGLARALYLYALHLDFAKVAAVLGTDRGPRRTSQRWHIARAKDKLLESDDPEEQAIGCWIEGLMISGGYDRGYRSRNHPASRADEGVLYRTDPDILGRFSMDVKDPDFGQMFILQGWT